VPLDQAPLVRVIAQVRFPLVVSVEKQEFIAPFQEAIRARYPVLRPEKSQGIVVGKAGGVVETRSSVVWRFEDTKGWRLSLAPDFAAIETVRYGSRDDFLERVEHLFEALRDQVDLTVMDRLGIRYIDRVVGENLRDLANLVRPEVAGVMGSELAENAQLSVAESLFALSDEGAQLKARWGLLPPHATIDPGAVDAVGERSWLLDLDAFVAETRDFDVMSASAAARGFCERIYSFFRWAVTDEFLRRYGGQP
jgi:uncharacterized protein (TIGR04255 family)